MTFKVDIDHLKNLYDSLEAYTTFQEKNALVVEDYEPDSKILKALSNVKPLNELEASLLLLKLREISVSDHLQLLATCPNCDTMNDVIIDLPKLFNTTDYSYYGEVKLPLGAFEKVEEILSDSVAEALPIKVYNEIQEILDDQNTELLKFNSHRCRSCNTEMLIKVVPRENYSRSTTRTIYQDYIDISMFSNNGKLDIDSLYPFEREIFVNLIKDRIKAEENTP